MNKENGPESADRSEHQAIDVMSEMIYRSAKWAGTAAKVIWFVLGLSLVLTLILVGLFILEGWRYGAIIWFELVFAVLIYLPAKKLSAFSNLISSNPGENFVEDLEQLRNYLRTYTVVVLLLLLGFLLF